MDASPHLPQSMFYARRACDLISQSATVPILRISDECLRFRGRFPGRPNSQWNPIERYGKHRGANWFRCRGRKSRSSSFVLVHAGSYFTSSVCSPIGQCVCVCNSYSEGRTPWCTYALRDVRSQRCNCFNPLAQRACPVKYNSIPIIGGHCNQIPLHSAMHPLP